ncbi:MAG TPA: four helix bundle protein [Nitrospiraceae bacterium]|nr:four helix bundle protein [Nitrospiraceae bacterium]
MKRVEKFEELVAWQKARNLTKAIYQVTRQGGFAKDFGLSTQIQRAIVSTMSNIAEGFERNRAAEFHQFLSMAKGSCAEVRSHLYVALDVGYIDQKKFDELLAQAEEVGRVIGGLRVSAEARKKPLFARVSVTQHSALNTQHL